jgi:type IV pilus assembly protein PilY1
LNFASEFARKPNEVIHQQDEPHGAQPGRRGRGAIGGILAVVGVVVGQSAPPAIPAVALSSEPLYARGFRAKPTLTLALSVEYPTVGAAYVKSGSRSNDDTYTVNTEYVGYFDPNGCYTYDDANNHFVRSGGTTGTHACDGSKFSGNFMNWATTSAIDILRYGLTGGDRIVDLSDKTVLQRAVLRSSFYNSDNFPSKQLKNESATEKAVAAGALPSTLRNSYTGTVFYVANCLNKVFFGTHRTGNCDDPESNGNLGVGLPPNTESRTSLSGFNTSSCANEGGSCTFTGARYVLYGSTSTNRYFMKAFQGKAACNNDIFGDPSPNSTKRCYVSTSTITPSNALTTDRFFHSRVQVCDSGDAASRSTLCVQQPSGNFKPSGNLQRYSDRMRVAVFGYLKDDSLGRYGGVLRAPMKYLGPKHFDNDFKLLAGANPKREWDETTGVFELDPEDAAENISGAVNYLNRFGRTASPEGEYKTYDPVSELYYEALRYIQGLDPTPQAVSNVTDAHKNGFPVYTTWTDPHPAVTGLSTTGDDTYACIKNNIITIGDVNTHADKSLPGNSLTRTGDSNTDFERTARPAYNEPDFVEWTRVVGAFESRDAINYVDGEGVTRTTSNPSTENDNNINLHTKAPGCCNGNRYYMAGAAYWANTHDIRAKGLANYDASKARPGMRATTFMIDVNEYAEQSAPATFKQNQFYLAAKYGGFIDRAQRGNPFVDEDGTTLDNTAWARTVTGASPDNLVAKNYFQGNNATELLAALDDIFATVVREAGSIAGAAVSSTRVTTDQAIFQGSFDPSDWSGDLIRYTVRQSSGTALIGTTEDVGTKFAAKELDALADIGTRKIFVGKTTSTMAGTATPFTWAGLDADHKETLRRPPAGTPLDTDTVGQQRLAYIRGDRSQEANGVMRRRGSRLGDIVNSGAVFSGKPVTIVGDSTYDAFASGKQNRKVVYVGANDGMLHAFHADTMQELFAYIPSPLVKNLRDFTLPGYIHRSFVDATPAVAEAKVGSSWKTVLVGGMGAGGQGVFALDVSSPNLFDESDVMWEFTDRDDPAMGNVIGRPQIVRMRTSAPGATATYKTFAIVAGGVNNYVGDGSFSGTGKAAIFILDLDKSSASTWQEGSNYFRIELPSGDATKANGIVGFSVVKGNGGEVQLLYAGDLQGNVWKLDFTAHGKSEWTAGQLSAFGSASTPEPFFIARDSTGARQPITVEPKIAYGPNKGYIVIFGTGKFLETSDLNTPYQSQTFYAVYDNGADAISGRSYLKQATTAAGVIDASPFAWGVPPTASQQGVRAGWYFDFPDATSGERQISGSTLVAGYVIFGTVEPAENGCSDGSGRVYFANLASAEGTYSASTVGIQGEPMVMKIGNDTLSDSTSAGRATQTTTYQVILQGSAGIKVSEFTPPAEPASILQRSWRQIFNFDEIRNE